MQAETKKIIRLLKTARGQLDGIVKMVEEDRYCMDVSNQILATRALLHTANREIVRTHLEHCVKQAFQEGTEDEKIKEILAIFDKLAK